MDLRGTLNAVELHVDIDTELHLRYHYVYASLSCVGSLREVPAKESALQHYSHWCALYILHTGRISLYCPKHQL
jgi:hypothetical protein